MNNYNDTLETAKTTMDYAKNVLTLLKQGKYLRACRELFGFFKSVYVLHIKGKYIEVKGKKIPMTAVVIAVAAVLYFMVPNSRMSGELALSEKADIAPNTYDKNGIRVYDMRKCNYAACGYLENATDKDYERIRITVIFHNQTGQAVFKGTADALQVAPRTRVEFDIPCSEEFAYFKLKNVVINPTSDEDDDDFSD